MDVNMPEIDGILATQIIMETCKVKNSKKPSIFALTAYDTKDCIE